MSSMPRSIARADIDEILEGRAPARVVAQPIVNVEGGSIAGYELLMRFGLEGVGPDAVFSAARAYGCGERFAAAMLARALEVAGQVPANTFVTINVEPHTLTTGEVQAVLATSRVEGVIFELTEHTMIEDLRGLRAQLDVLRGRGAFIALDDAGSGYSGLRQLVELAPDFIKLDRELLSKLHEHEAKRVLVEMVGELADRLDAWLVAEGIETVEEHDAIAKLGVPLAQGYLYGRPSAPWGTVDAAARFVASPSPNQAHTVGHLVAPCEIVDERAVVWSPVSRTSLALDTHGRPSTLWLVTDRRRTHELMKIKRDTELAAAARRALARPEVYRWDPLICVDDAGKFEGIVTVERMVEALADIAHARGATGCAVGSGVIPVSRSGSR